MSIRSPFPDVNIPECNILTQLLLSDKTLSGDPIWIETKDTSISLSLAQLLKWAKRLAFGLGKEGLKRSDVVLICTPNHIFVPNACLGTVGGGYTFSGANSVYNYNKLAYQIKNLEAPILLIHPALIKNAIAATKQAGLPKSRIFQFSIQENPTIEGIKNWRHSLGKPEKGGRYKLQNLL